MSETMSEAGADLPAAPARAAFAERFLAELPHDLRAALNESQRAALVQTAERMFAANWQPLHPVDIRLSLWLPFRRLYLTVIAGREKRDRARIAELRRRHPLRRLGNILFIGAAAAVFYSLALVVVLLLMSVVEV